MSDFNKSSISTGAQIHNDAMSDNDAFNLMNIGKNSKIKGILATKRFLEDKLDSKIVLRFIFNLAATQ